VPVANLVTRTCSDAAAGLERATRGIRAPEDTVLAPMRTRCTEDAWSVEAIECFAAMQPDDLGACAGKLSKTPREAMLAVLAGIHDDRAAVAVVVARLATLKVGVPACDQFVAAVATVMTCEGLPLETRVQLGNETADFWSLPTSGLPPDAQAKMTSACGESLAALQRESTGAGCAQ
jgi:hypothetical protein